MDLVRDEDNYFKRQPRVNPQTLNYNFEQFKRYTKMLEKAIEKDNYESKRFYKLINYIKQNASNDRDPIVRKFIYEDGNDPFKIPIPEEF